MIRIIKDWIKEYNQQYWIVNEDNVIVGEFKLSEPTTRGDYIWFFDFKIKESYRNQGIGTETLKLILQMEELKKKSILLTVDRDNTVAVRLYNKFGFKLISSSMSIKTDDTYKLIND